MYKSILVMTDFSKDSDFAVQTACELASKFDAKLYVMHVGHLDPGFTVLLDDEDLKKVERRMDESVENEFIELERRIPCILEVKYQRVYRRGVPYEEGLKETETGKYDLLVLGSHGRSGIKRFFYGGTTAKLARRAPISTLITRLND